uniref:NTR domain-containing protein n=1 Tax=Steinernema glaseri TaxID=37863 RepID=A0A1I7ZDB6_9BILA
MLKLSIRRAMLLWTAVFFLVFVSSSTAETCIYPKVLGGVYCDSLVIFSTERSLPNLDSTLDELLKANKKSVDCKRPSIS